MQTLHHFRRALRPAALALVAFALGAGVRPAAAQTTPETPDLNDGDFNRGGRTAFQFLKIGVGARQAALGEASVALVEDASAAFWNPASISGIETSGASLSYARWLAGMNYAGLAVGHRVDGIGTFALSVAALDYGDIPESVVDGTGDGRTGNTFSGGDFMAGVSYAREFTDRLAIGATVKYVHESLFDYGTGALAFDVGTNYDVGYRGIRLAMSAQNLGGATSFLADSLTDRTEGYDMPLVFRVGMSGNIVGPNALVSMEGASRLIGTVEAINTNDYNERFHAGLEYQFSDLLAIRGGYRFNYEEGNWALGVGINPRFGNVRMSVDYAYVGYEFLDAPHRFTLTFRY